MSEERLSDLAMHYKENLQTIYATCSVKLIREDSSRVQMFVHHNFMYNPLLS